MKYSAVFLIGFILSGHIYAGKGEKNSNIGYPSVEAALNAIQANPDPNISITEFQGWKLVTINRGSDNEVLWSFTPETHPAYPAAIKRNILRKDRVMRIRMNVLCEAGKQECDALIAEFEQRNEAVRKRLQASFDRPETFVKTAGKAVGEVLNYDKKSFMMYRRSYEKISFSVYGKKQLEYLTVECDKSVYYEIGTLTANIAGALGIGLCTKSPLLTRDVIQNQRKYLHTVLGALSTDLAETDENLFETSAIGNGVMFYYFPVFVVGHGILSVQTSMAVSDDPDKVLIIQYTGQNLCERLPDLKLCTDPKSTLKELSRIILGQ